MRVLADHDYDRAQQVADWPIREGLLALTERMRDQAIETFRHEQIFWALKVPILKTKPKPPEIPRILK